MITDLAQAKTAAAEMFVHFSTLLAKGIRDAEGKFVGNVWDIAVKRSEVYPKTEELIVRSGTFGRMYASVPWKNVARIEDDIILATKSSELLFGKDLIGEYELLLRRDILDQQVVDTYNHKVRRVNDIHLLRVESELMVAHVDIGLRGLVRRLGWEGMTDTIVRFFNKNAPYLKREEIISWKYVQPVSINPASMTMKLSVSEKQLLSIPAADLGEIIFDLNLNQRMALFRSLDVKMKASIFENLEADDQKAILKELDKKEAAQIVSYMSSDEATDLLERLPQASVRNLLTLIESTRAKKLSTLLGYSSDSAGGLMTTEFVSLLDTAAIGTALDDLKKETRETEPIPYIFLVDEKNRLKGVTTVRRLLIFDPKDPIAKTVLPNTVYVYLNNSVKEVAYLMDKYKVSAIPVIDEGKVLQGVITMDDVLGQVISIAWRKRTRAQKGL